MDFEALIRFSQVMPSADAALDLRVLKAHLLAEEALNAYIEFELPRGQLVSEGRSNFAAKNRIAKAITEPGQIDWVWDAFEKLNRLRNSFAHQIDDCERDKKMEAFITSCEVAPQWSSLSEDCEDCLTLAIFMSCLELESHVQSRRQFRRHLMIQRDA